MRLLQVVDKKVAGALMLPIFALVLALGSVTPALASGKPVVDGLLDPQNYIGSGTVNSTLRANVAQIQQNATIGDRVWFDANDNGIQDGGESNVPGVTVQIYNAGTNGLVATTTTNASGLYAFTVAAGSYYVQFVLPPGYLFTLLNQGADDAIDSDADGNNGGRTAAFSVAAGEQRSDIDAGLIRNADVCYGVADGYGAFGNAPGAQDTSAADTLAYLNRVTGQTAAVGTGPIGNTGTNNIEAIAFRPGGAALYATNGGQLGTLNLITGLFTALPNPIGVGSGSAGNINLIDVDGLTFDPTNGILYGTERRDPAGQTDLLFQIDPNTGLLVQNVFAGNDYVEVGAAAGLFDVDDIAIDPVTGIFYGSLNNGGSSTNKLVIIDRNTGATTEIGTIQVNANSLVQDVEGLSFFNDGRLYGSTGKDGPTTNGLWQIDQTTGIAIFIGNFTAPLQDIEGISCLTSSEPFIVLKKYTNDEDADLPTGPVVPVGSTVTWKYFVRNTGSVALLNVVVTDDKIGAITCPQTTLAVGESMTCIAQGVAVAGQYANVGTVQGISIASGIAVSDTDPSHYFAAGPAIDIEKATNGDDADTPTGPTVPVGSTVTWTYVVTNIGDVPLSQVAVTDDKIGAITCPKTTLAVGESMTCTVQGIAVAGQYANIGSVTGNPPTGSPVSDTDPSHYFAAAGPAIDIEKATNGDDADTPTGPIVLIGSTVNWTYVVTNTGDVPLSQVAVTDDRIGAITCPQTTLAVGESMTCMAQGIAVAGQYANIGSVTGNPPEGSPVSDTDPSHYFAFSNQPAIDIEKATNGDDADTPTGPIVLIDSTVTWTYVVANIGNVALSQVAVVDDKIGAISCPQTTLAVGESMTCTAQGIAVAGQYANTGSVTGNPPEGSPVSDSDPSHYFGAQPATLGDRVWFDSIPTTGDGRQDKTGADFIESGVPGVIVELYRVDNVFVMSQTTTVDGFYLFTNLVPGQYYVKFILPPGTTGIFTLQNAVEPDVDSDADGEGQTGVITLASGEVNLTIDAGLINLSGFASASIGDRVWLDVNRNNVQDAGDQAFASPMTVNLYQCVAGVATGAPVETMTLGGLGAGIYLFDGLDAGDYLVEFVLPNGHQFVTPDQGGNDSLDSDAALGTGRTPCTNLAEFEEDMTWDAGLFETGGGNTPTNLDPTGEPGSAANHIYLPAVNR